MTICGQALIILGLLHVPLYFVGDGGWEGSVSWRKPILFGISTGMTLWSLGWLAKHLKPFLWDVPVAVLLSIALSFEVLLIALQQWRGEASHFNRGTPLDAGIDLAMLILIVIAVAGICYFFCRCFNLVNLAQDYRTALVIGMLLLIISCAIGFVISSHGYAQADRNLPSEVVGTRGVAKFPHGVAIHALQMLPGLIWLMRRLRFNLNQRMMMLWATTGSTALLLLFALLQTWSGYDRFEIATTGSMVLLAASLATIAVPATLVLWQRFGRPEQSEN